MNASVGLMSVAVAFAAAAAAETLVFDQPQCAGMSGFRAHWSPPNYDVPRGNRVLVRPTFTVNGTEVAIDSDFINGRAVSKSPSVELVDRVLRLQTPAGRLEVDWWGKAPVFRNQ